MSVSRDGSAMAIFAMSSEEHVFTIEIRVCECSALGDKVKGFTKSVRDSTNPHPHQHLACGLEMLTNEGMKALQINCYVASGRGRLTHAYSWVSLNALLETLFL